MAETAQATESTDAPLSNEEKQKALSQFNEARLMLNRGNIFEASALYKHLSLQFPHLSQPHYFLAAIEILLKNYKTAQGILAKAIESTPKHVMLWQFYLECSMSRVPSIETINTLIKDLNSAPIELRHKMYLQKWLRKCREDGVGNLAVSISEKAKQLMALNKDGKYKECAIKAQEIMKLNTIDSYVLAAFGEALSKLGDQKNAEGLFRAASTEAPMTLPIIFRTANFFYNIELNFEAVMLYHRCMLIQPNLKTLHARYGKALIAMNQYTRAKEILDEALTKGDKLAEVWFALGQYYENKKDTDAAAEAYDKAIDLGIPDQVAASLRKAINYSENSQTVYKALPILAMIEEQYPDNHNLYAIRARTYQHLGNFEAAASDLRKKLELTPDDIEGYSMLSSTTKFKPGDPIIDKMRTIFLEKTLPVNAYANLGFAFAKALEDVKEYHEQLDILKIANDKMHQYYLVDRDRENEKHEKLKMVQSLYMAKHKSTPGLPEISTIPIFICGMPRTGSTLIEQIVSSHSQIDGSGECNFIQKAFFEILKDLDRTDDDIRTPILTPEAIRDFRLRYIELQKQNGYTKRFVTDKSLGSYEFIPLIYHAFPEARFFVVHRDPRENLFSMYKRYFKPGTHRYTYNLDDLIKTYAFFRRIVNTYSKQFPSFAHQIHYEDVINDTQNTLESMFKVIDVELEEACLEFYKSERSIHTLSVYQVRQPLYKSSLETLKRYGDRLSDFIEKVNELEKRLQTEE